MVNDDAPSLLALCGVLRAREDRPGYTILMANSGQAALREVLRHDFAVVFLDVNMPGMDGYETAEAIRSRPRCAQTPIIFVTAYLADEFDRTRAYGCGAADFLFSPVIPQILQAKADVFVKLFAQNAQLLRQSRELEERTAQLVFANVQLESEIVERAAAERENEARDEFLAMLGHELRNPLSAISSAGSVIGMAGADPDTRSKARAIIQRQSRHMMTMVEDVLDLSRASTGKLTIEAGIVDLSAVVSDCVATLAAQAVQHTLTSVITPTWIVGDPSRVAQMVNHLIENAIKYTPAPGSIHVEVLQQEGESLITVRDTGEGLSEDTLPHVFDVFVQAGVTIDRRRGGLGIGLAMVKQLCELHGGQATARSDGIGRGSIFALQFPTARSPLAAIGPS
ncbi:MAG: hybrid sensor histidine kinase/response regulator [Pseudomonadota bacterium]